MASFYGVQKTLAEEVFRNLFDVNHVVHLFIELPDDVID